MLKEDNSKQVTTEENAMSSDRVSYNMRGFVQLKSQFQVQTKKKYP